MISDAELHTLKTPLCVHHGIPEAGRGGDAMLCSDPPPFSNGKSRARAPLLVWAAHVDEGDALGQVGSQVDR